MQPTDFGEIAGNTSATAMPSSAGTWAKFKAQSDNAGKVYIGFSDVTKDAGTEDATSGYQLAPGEETPWLPTVRGNISNFYRICDNAGDDLSYVVLQ